MLKSVAYSLGILAFAGAANAASVSVHVYKDGSFSENQGHGITFTGSPSMATTFSADANGFYLDWSGPSVPRELPVTWRNVKIVDPIPPYSPPAVFGADFKGEFQVAKAGPYTLTFGADDAGYLFIDGALAASTPAAHGVYYVTPTVALTVGTHRFEIQYNNTVCCRAITALYTPDGVTLGGFVSARLGRPMHH